MDSRTARILVSAFVLLGFSLYNFVTYTSTISYQSTFSLQPGLAYEIPATLNPSDIITVQFQENSGMPVSFYILSSAEFASHQANQPFSYLYAVTNVPSGTYSYTIIVQDTYYLFFDHGTGLGNTIETVYSQRMYTTHSDYRLGVGILFLAIAGVDFFYAYRSRKRAQPPPAVNWPPSGPSPTTSVIC